MEIGATQQQSGCAGARHGGFDKNDLLMEVDMPGSAAAVEGW
jgi:hypothetical protein